MMKLLEKLQTKIVNVLAGSAVLIAWIFGAQILWSNLLGINYVHAADQSFQMFFWACIMAPLWEEYAFRHFPLTVAKKLGIDPIRTLIFTSILFGLGHQGLVGLLLQGVGGFIMGYIYLRNGYSYWSSVAMHFLWNFTVIFIT